MEDYNMKRLQRNFRNAYLIIEQFYGDTRAKRSGVLMMNHINEGLNVMRALNATPCACAAYCLHPITQNNCPEDWMLEREVPPYIWEVAYAYSAAANSFLPSHIPQGKSAPMLKLSADLRTMLIADKIQNSKDFYLYHSNTHENAATLRAYFSSWLHFLGQNSVNVSELTMACDLPTTWKGNWE